MTAINYRMMRRSILIGAAALRTKTRPFGLELKGASGAQLNQELERANRVADFLEFGELLVLDALVREESCGGHFREESQTPDGEALRDDENFSHVSAWEYTGVGADPVLHKEKLEFEYVHPSQRSYA